MLEPAEPGAPVLEWLSSLHLGLYGPALLRGGYRTLEACRRLTDGALLELQVFPTGHRRRILRSLEVLGGEGGPGEGGGGWRAPVPCKRNVFLKDKKRAETCSQPAPGNAPPTGRGRGGEGGSHSLPPGAGLGAESDDEDYDEDDDDDDDGPGSGVAVTMPPVPAPRHPHNILSRPRPPPPTTSPPPDVVRGSPSLSSDAGEILTSDWEEGEGEGEEPSSSDSAPRPSPDSAPRPPAESWSAVEFQGDMVDNVIYETGPPSRGPRPTRSYRLRHRPVPRIPPRPPLPPLDR
ncbi:unnamed protein product [Boreogadus saida]